MNVVNKERLSEYTPILHTHILLVPMNPVIL